MKQYILLSLVTVLFVTGCGNQSPKNTEKQLQTKEASQEKIEIITSFYPLFFLTEQIAGDLGKVTNLAGSVDVHEYQPSPQDLVQINQANLVIAQGAQLEPWTASVFPELKEKGVKTLTVTKNLNLAKLDEHEDHSEHDDHEEETHEGEHEDEHHDEHEEENHHDHSHDHHDEEEEEDHHDEHNHGEFDPHTWLDPVLVQDMVNEITTAIIETDPTNAKTYVKNANDLRARLSVLSQNYQTNLASCNQNEVIVSHDAYGYIARRYNLTLHNIAGLAPNDEPSAQILAELKAEAEEGITHILIEENSVRRFAETLAQETGLKTLPITPMGQGILDPEKDYFDVMEENLQSLTQALDCQA